MDIQFYLFVNGGGDRDLAVVANGTAAVAGCVADDSGSAAGSDRFGISDF